MMLRSNINLIGLYGPSRSGKDSVAQFLADDFGYEQRAMADAIRTILLKLDPVIMNDRGTFFTMQHLFEAHNEDWDEVKANSRESVDYMIRLGQGCRDVLGEDVWINRVLPANISDAKIVISDVRQPNEYHAIRQRGGLIWRISREGTEKRGMDGLLEGYEFDAHIKNRGTLPDLRESVTSHIYSAIDSGRVLHVRESID